MNKMNKTLLQVMADDVQIAEEEIKHAQIKFDEALATLMAAYAKSATANERIRIAMSINALSPEVNSKDEQIVDELMAKRKGRGIIIRIPKEDKFN